MIEVILRPRKKPSFGKPKPLTRIRAKIAVARRIVDVVSTARRNGLAGRRSLSRASVATPEGAGALRGTLEDCGGVFVKSEQIAAGREDFLPLTLTAELSRLRSAAKPVPFEIVPAVLVSDFGSQRMGGFDWFDEEPPASASIAVTHRGRLRGGRPVVVKVQRPHVDNIVRRD